MCGVNEAMMAMKVVGAVAEKRAEDDAIRSQNEANAKNRQNALNAYYRDLSDIERERGSTAREKAIADFRSKQETKKLKAAALNLNLGNATSVLRDIGVEGELDILDNFRQFETDMSTLNRQRDQAYDALESTYNNAQDRSTTGLTGLGLAIGTASGEYLNKPSSERKWFKKLGNQN